MRRARVRPREEMYKDAKLGKFFNFPPRKAARLGARYDRGEGGELATIRVRQTATGEQNITAAAAISRHLIESLAAG